MTAAITVRYWAGAQRAAGVEQESMTATTIGDLRAQLAARRDLAKLSGVVSFLVDEAPSSDSTALYDGAIVDVLPPFAGG